MASLDLPTEWLIATLLISLRVGPALTMAPPFSLTKFPASFRLLLALGLAAGMASGAPQLALKDLQPGSLLAAAFGELAIGLVFVVALQLMFGAIQTAGRTIDIQAGFGLAGVIDPATGGQSPVVGALLLYATAAVFFALDGHVELLRAMRASLEIAPVGASLTPPSLGRLATFVSALFIAAFGIAGGAILTLFLADLAIALLSRTVPQMNVLVLGFQVKTLLLLIVLPLTLGVSGALIVRMIAFTLQTLPSLIR